MKRKAKLHHIYCFVPTRHFVSLRFKETLINARNVRYTCKNVTPPVPSVTLDLRFKKRLSKVLRSNSLCYHKYISYEIYEGSTKCGRAMHKSNTNIYECTYTYISSEKIDFALSYC